ncbi:hypothetical protein E4T56_gene1655 [Termitomyces sp. T112]|nr:hypothetical protein E4T56_gene1655 [Termitomyces sp. T112]
MSCRSHGCCFSRYGEPFSVAPPLRTTTTKVGLVATVVSATPGPTATSGASSWDMPMEESMALDYVDEPSAPMEASPETTSPVVPGPSKATVATNIATSIVLKVGTSGSSDTANAVLECWVDIVSSKEAASLQMDEQAE